MQPAFSVIFFTTLAGAAQGLVIALAVARLMQMPLPQSFVFVALALAGVLLLVALVASSLHLGRPERAWRAVLMWRTSWLSREVIVLPAFIALVFGWLALEWTGIRPALLPWVAVAAIVLAAALWLCTAMIYACLTFIQEWAHPLTLVNYTLLGLASGLVLTAALAALMGVADFAHAAAWWGLLFTLVAATTRTASLVRNARLRPRSTLQSAIGIQADRIVQTSMGMSAGAFNTREFFHGKSLWLVRRIKLASMLLGFVVPAILLSLALFSGQPVWLFAATVVQFIGLIADRWLFFAQARHPQNLYYQMVS